MGRGIIPIKKIEDNRGRKSTFSKRYPCVYKKGYEISVLTGTDFSVLTSNCNGKLCYFSHPKRAEDALDRFLNMPDDEKIVTDWDGQQIGGRIPIGYKDQSSGDCVNNWPDLGQAQQELALPEFTEETSHLLP